MAVQAFVTGEAVPLDLPLARVPSRALAFLVDVIVQLALLAFAGPAFILLVLLIFEDLAWFNVALLIATVGVLVGYPVLCETITRGRSPGKFIAGVQVIRNDGGPIDFRHALTRGLTGALVDFWGIASFGLVAAGVATCDRQSRRLGDMLAGTVVVVCDAPLPMPKLAAPPPWLAAWVSGVRVTALTDELALATRQYLTRYRELAPAVRDQLAAELAQRVCAQLGAVSPAGAQPLAVLGAVIAERQRREIQAKANA